MLPQTPQFLGILPQFLRYYPDFEAVPPFFGGPPFFEVSPSPGAASARPPPTAGRSWWPRGASGPPCLAPARTLPHPGAPPGPVAGIWDPVRLEERDPCGDGILDQTHGWPPHLGNVHGEPPTGGPDEPLDAFGPAQQQLGPLQVIAALGPERSLRQLPPPQLQELQLLLGWEGPPRGSGQPHPPCTGARALPTPCCPCPNPSCTFSSRFGSRVGIPGWRWMFGRGRGRSAGLNLQ